MHPHRELQEWVQEMARMCEPDKIVWIDGSDEERTASIQEAVNDEEVLLLDQEKYPGCVYHRTASERRRPHRAPDVHLHDAARRRRADQQLDVARGGLPPARRDLSRAR